MTSLAPAYKSVLRAQCVLAALLLLILAVIGDFIATTAGFVPGVISVIAAMIGLLLVLFIPGRRYRAWRYDETADELHIDHGIMILSSTIVPFGRVQHIDVSQGPIERRYGVGTLTLFTAGTRNSAVSLPGIDHEEAGRMRDRIRGKIRQDLV